MRSNPRPARGGGAGGGAKYRGPEPVRGGKILIKHLVMGWGPVMRNHLLVLGPDPSSRQP